VKVSSFDSFVVRDPSGACGLMATRAMPLGQRGHELRLVGAQGDVAVGAPAAAVEHDDGGLAAQVLGERGRLAADVEQCPVRQPAAGLCHAGRVAGCGQVALLGDERPGDLGGQLAGRGPVMAGDLLGDRRCSGHGMASCERLACTIQNYRMKLECTIQNW
jgi:hypothetical protein